MYVEDVFLGGAAITKTFIQGLIKNTLSRSVAKTMVKSVDEIAGSEFIDDGLRMADQPFVQGTLSNKIPTGKLANHIFSGKAGKLADTPENRILIESIANDPKTKLGVSEYGTSWYAKTLDSGKQIYVYTERGVIKGAGINDAPIDIMKAKGLK